MTATMTVPVRRFLPIALATPALTLALVACEPVTLTMLGVGAGAGVSHQMGGLAYRTFTAPLPRVKAAALTALKRMEIRVEAVEKTANGEILRGVAADRKIEVELESLTPSTTRIKAVARKDTFLVDSATAVEIITQIEKAMGA